MSPGEREAALRHLTRTDNVLARLVEHVGPFKLRRSPSYFITLVEAVVWQQLSWKAANSIYTRVLDAAGTRRPRPQDLLRAGTKRLRAAGLSARKAEYLLGIAGQFDANAFPRGRIRSMDDEEIIEELSSIRGIGRWSAEMFLIFALNRPDVFPVGDLGLRKAIGRMYAAGDLPSDDDLARISAPWRPYRTVASWYLWAGADGVPFA